MDASGKHQVKQKVYIRDAGNFLDLWCAGFKSKQYSPPNPPSNFYARPDRRARVGEKRAQSTTLTRDSERVIGARLSTFPFAVWFVAAMVPSYRVFATVGNLSGIERWSVGDLGSSNLSSPPPLNFLHKVGKLEPRAVRNIFGFHAPLILLYVTIHWMTVDPIMTVTSWGKWLQVSEQIRITVC